jgi:hypothetical protein
MYVASNRRRTAALIASLAVAGAAHADVVRLSRGRKVEGEIVAETATSLVVAVGGARMTIDRADVESVERKATPTQRIRESRANLAVGDAKGALALADAAAAAGLVDDEGAALKLASQWAPDDPVAASRLRRWTVANVRPASDRDEDARLVRDTGPAARLLRSMHWTLAYDGPTDGARRAADAMETVWRKFHAFAETLGVPTKPVERALTAQLFTDFDAWKAAVRGDATSFADVTAVYLVRARRVAIVDAATRPDSRALSASLRAADDELARGGADLLDLRSTLEAFRQAMKHARMNCLTVRKDAVAALEETLAHRRDEESRRSKAVRSSADRLETAFSAMRLDDEGRDDLVERAQRAIVELDAESADRRALVAEIDHVLAELSVWRDVGYVVFHDRELRAFEDLPEPLESLARDIWADTKERRALIDGIRRDVEDGFAASSVSAASRAACRQLGFETGLTAAEDPRWLTEGLVSMFEVSVGRTLIWDKPRLERLRAARDAWKDYGEGWLAQLVGGTAFDADPASAHAGGYVLVWYLARERPAEFARYLRRARKPATDRVDRDIREFELQFGALSDVEWDLLRYVERR